MTRGDLARPEGLLESTRWLFGVLAAAAVVVISLAPLATTTGHARVLTVLSTVGVLAAIDAIYRTGRSRLWLDVAQVGMLFILSVNCPVEGAMFNLAFPLLWFESFYGRTGTAYLRCVAFTAALFVGIPVGFGRPDDALPHALVAFGTLAAAMLSVAGARHLLATVVERQHELTRHSVLAWAGSELLGLTDPQAIRSVAWGTVAKVEAVTPGLHVLTGVLRETGLSVTTADDEEHGTATQLPVELVPPLLVEGDRSGHRVPGLDAVVGAVCTWVAHPLPDRRHSGWMLIGSEGTLPPDVLDTLDGLTVQVTLALRNSDAHRRLTHDASVDSLTGLANRSAFETALISTPTDHEGDLTVFFIDLDDFKDVNDLHGHLAGDTVLREVATRLLHICRADDLCVRLGGDEFAVLAHLHDAAAALELGRRLAEALDDPVDIGRPEPVPLGASVGVAMAGPDVDPMRLVRCADVAMYAAKGAGKGTVRMYSPALEDSRQFMSDSAATQAPGPRADA